MKKKKGRLKLFFQTAFPSIHLLPGYINHHHFRLRTQAKRHAPKAEAGGNEKVAVADLLIALCEPVHLAHNQIGRRHLAVVHMA